jgi:hypothetical protein
LARKFSSVLVRGEGDEAVIEAAVREHAMVLTADRGLQERLRRRGITVLAPRDRHRLEVRPPRSRRPAPRSGGTPAVEKSSRSVRARGNG